MKAITLEQAREFDSLAQVEYGLSALVLMENAGRSVCDEVLKIAKAGRLSSVAFFCGKGNNAGDGFVAARHLLAHGLRCDVFLAGWKKEPGLVGVIENSILKDRNYKGIKNEANCSKSM